MEQEGIAAGLVRVFAHLGPHRPAAMSGAGEAQTLLLDLHPAVFADTAPEPGTPVHIPGLTTRVPLRRIHPISRYLADHHMLNQ